MWAGVVALITAATTILGVQIKDLKVPPSVRNGSRSALLDCEYKLKPDELAADSFSGLVVKWYFNNSPSPVYQWIPGQKPQDLGILKGKLNLSHRASENAASMHRALYISYPTTELSGDYKCLVSTFDDEDFMTKKMVVYVPESSLDMMQSKPDLDSVQITCTARGVYPEPKMALLRGSETTTSMEDVMVKTVPRKGSYDIVASKVVQDSDLKTPTEFACELRIPEAQYSVKKTVVYYPGLSLLSSDSGTTYSYCWVLTSLSFLLSTYRGTA